jgi:hypothetical protein
LGELAGSWQPIAMTRILHARDADEYGARGGGANGEKEQGDDKCQFCKKGITENRAGTGTAAVRLD